MKTPARYLNSTGPFQKMPLLEHLVPSVPCVDKAVFALQYDLLIVDIRNNFDVDAHGLSASSSYGNLGSLIITAKYFTIYFTQRSSAVSVSVGIVFSDVKS